LIEIIPNWHPFFVHFSIGLLSISIFFYFISAVLPVNHKLKLPWLNTANWSLWMGCLLTVFTVTAGWFAYNSVPHDTVSHAAMTLHRNWALPTALSFLLFGLWAIYLARKDKRPGVVFLMVSLLLLASLSIVGWLGAEAVYRYGLGVRSLPEVEAGSDGHAHSHEAEAGSDGHAHSHEVEVVTDDHLQSHEVQAVSDSHTHTHAEQAVKEINNAQKKNSVVVEQNEFVEKTQHKHTHVHSSTDHQH